MGRYGAATDGNFVNESVCARASEPKEGAGQTAQRHWGTRRPGPAVQFQI